MNYLIITLIFCAILALSCYLGYGYGYAAGWSAYHGLIERLWPGVTCAVLQAKERGSKLEDRTIEDALQMEDDK